MALHNIVLVSDTHLSLARPHFNGNWTHFERGLEALQPELVINTGDVALDGADREEDLQLARDFHEDLPVPYMAIPGNHDVGDAPDNPLKAPRQPVTDARRARWQDHFGSDFWCRKLHGWHLIGLNAQLLGTGLDAEQEQWKFIQDSLSGTDLERALIFIHKPIFVDSLEEPEEPGRCIRQSAARRLQALFDDAPVRAVFSGHVHQQRQLSAYGRQYIWVPSSAFILPAYFQPDMGEKKVGCALLQIDDESDLFSVDFHRPEGMQNINLDDVKDAYGDLRAFAKERDAAKQVKQ